MSSFEGENMQTQYNILGFRTDYKLAIEIDENKNSDRSIGYKKTKRDRTRTWL